MCGPAYHSRSPLKLISCGTSFPFFYFWFSRTSLLIGEGDGTHSSTLAWKIPWTEEPGRLQSMGSWRVGHNWATSLSLFTFTQWRRKWQPTPVFLPGESQGRGSLVGCPLWGRIELGHDWSYLAAAAAACVILSSFCLPLACHISCPTQYHW